MMDEETEEPEDPLKCPVCGDKKPNKQSIGAHIRRHTATYYQPFGQHRFPEPKPK